ncbi:TadE/TadG family type IV pilus assembly protein [Puniceibacterium confluentis]|uniref:TadE/TadG family type IV pilus assembly protein n=1 Tax=Puniceibacterium confluentis TaxID=1958944 RepID=UPI003567BCF6
MTRSRNSRIRNFLNREDGSVLVEFALVMPLMLAVFAVTVESAKMMKSYQAAVAGVRDAARYMARTTPSNICDTGGSVADLTATLKDIVENDLGGNALMPSSVTVNYVTPSYSCVIGSYRVSPAPVGTVTANMTLQFPLSGILDLFGGSLSTQTTTITDQARIFGQ